MRLARDAALALVLWLVAALAAAQGPEAEWRTIETTHFRVHFPATAGAWAARVAGRLETIRIALADEVGYAPPQIVDVVVADPMARANGSAWPLLGRPRLVLWTTPPSASSGLGHLTDWGELLAVHEIAHLAHLLRPSRDPLRSLAERTVLPVGPLPLKIPRWAIEGYATLLEGRLTGSGRPGSALRAAILRQWGRQGRLPSYARLSKDPDRFLGMSMAYLAGSAYLEWLERRPGGPASLRDLWAAASARGRRGFDEAFERVFAEHPEALWDRFRAETAAAAIERERHLAGSVREGEIWLDRSGATRGLQVAPDGRRLLAVVGHPRRPDRLVLWSLGSDPAAAEPPAAAIDPEDPPRVDRPPREREPIAELEAPPGSRLLSARFLPDGDRLLVGLAAPDLGGTLHGELAVWRPGTGLRRITRGADVREADPLPGGRLALAVRWRDGGSSLVRVDLESGEVDELTPHTVELVHDRPRVSPDGRRAAWLEHSGGRWRLRLATLDAEAGLATVRGIEPEREGEPIDLAWRGDGSLLYAAVARGEELEIEALPVREDALGHRVTRSHGAALAPAPTPDGTALFYLGLDADGLDVRRLRLDAATLQGPLAGEPAATGGDPVTPRFAADEVAAPRAYGWGRGEPTPLLGGTSGSDDGALEAGLRLGDLLGRWELVALGSAGSGGATRGGSLRLAARRLPVTFSFHVARLRDELGELDAAELAGARILELGRTRVRLSGGAGWSRQREPERDRLTGFVGLRLVSALASGRLRLEPGVALDASRGFGDSEQRLAAVEVHLDARAGEWRARFELERREASRIAGDRDRIRLGGAPTSIAPSSARTGRLEHSALAPGTLNGSDYDGQRLRLRARSPLALRLERHRVDGGPWLRLAALELRWDVAALPLLGVPALRFDVGAAVVDGAGFDRDARWWIGLTFPFVPRAVAAPAFPAFSSLPGRR